MKLGIYGGTFDPPHLGHLTALQTAIRQLKLDRTLIIPTYAPPHKEPSQNMASCEDRLKMAELCFGGLENVEIWDGEIRRGGKSYTIDTIRQIKEDYQDWEIVLMMGTDMYVSFETWREYRELLKLVTCGVFTRNDGEYSALESQCMLLEAQYGARTEAVCNTPIEISSTQLRELLPKRMGREYLKDEVYSYIIKNRLFSAKPDFDWLRIRAYDMLKEKRIRHVAGCEAEAVKLAMRWGCNTELAREAAILHDVTKKYDLVQQLNLCSEYGIILDDVEKNEVKLLHSKTGAYIAADLFGADDEVFDAILWHTTGKENMTLLEKVIYLADYIEPNRAFDGVEPLRLLCYEDIDAALKLGLEMSIVDMLERGIEPHERSARALKWLKHSGTADVVL